jgi:(2R)-sulfolactate sulfo-lyase subunit alpha
MSIPHLLVHNKLDNVGVVVVEGVEAGTDLLAIVTEDNSDFTITTQHDIPIGHKIALSDFTEGDTVIKYGVDIGRIVQNTNKGEHIHTHNLKTKRW